MPKTITFHCPHRLPDGEECQAEVSVECEVEPGDVWGEDADGNRGEWRPAYVVAPDYNGEVCTEGHSLTLPEEIKAWEDRAEEAATEVGWVMDE